MHEVALDLLILLGGIWLVAVTLRPLGLPTVMGELIVGVLVGPAVLGLIEPSEAITLLAEIGIFFLMFHAGVETQPTEFFHALKRSLGVAVVGAVVPFAVSFGVATAFGLGRVGCNVRRADHDRHGGGDHAEEPQGPGAGQHAAGPHHRGQLRDR